MAVIDLWPQSLFFQGYSFDHLSFTMILTLILLFLLVYLVYRLYLHPLAHFSGPLAAATSTRWLYKALMTGHAEEIFEKLHARYQTKALRIGPNELHISDVHQYSVIYNHTNPFPKYATFYDAFSIPHAVFSEVDPVLHKERRQLLNPCFSRTTLFKLESLIQARARALAKKIQRLGKNEPSIDLLRAVRCFSFDVTLSFTFGCSPNVIEEEDTIFDSQLLQAFDSLSAGRVWTNAEWPIRTKILKRLPRSINRLISPKNAPFSKIIRLAQSCVENYEARGNTTSHPVVFDHLVSVPLEDKVPEAINMLFAGFEPTTSSLMSGVLHILLDANVEKKLVNALENVQVNEHGWLPLLELERVDYLVACVKESLRIGIGAPGRLPRVVPTELTKPFIVDGKVIPAGTIVSISAYTMNLSEELWGPDAKAFNPDRWLKPESKQLNQYFCTFSKGTRMCLGQNVAFAEVTILLAYLFKNFKLSLPSDFQMPERKEEFAMKWSAEDVHVIVEPAVQWGLSINSPIETLLEFNYDNS